MGILRHCITLLKAMRANQFFADLTEFLIHDDKWKNITNKRRGEYDKLKKHLHETKGQDLKIDKYLFLIETKIFKK